MITKTLRLNEKGIGRAGAPALRVSFFSVAGLPSAAHNLVFLRRYSLALITTWMPLPSRSLANFLASASEPTIAP